MDAGSAASVCNGREGELDKVKIIISAHAVLINQIWFKAFVSFECFVDRFLCTRKTRHELHKP